MTTEEQTDLDTIANSEDPMTRIIYHMANRQLYLMELLTDARGSIQRIEEELIRQDGRIKRLRHLDLVPDSNGSGV